MKTLELIFALLALVPSILILSINNPAELLYRFFVWIDRKTGMYESYSYETAPYCGHHYSGHDGFFTHSRFHEGDGQGQTHGWFHRYILGVWYHTEEGYGFSVPVYAWCRWFYYAVKRYYRFLTIKVQYPNGRRTLFIRTVSFGSYRIYTRGVSDTNFTLHVIRLNSWFFPISHSTL